MHAASNRRRVVLSANQNAASPTGVIMVTEKVSEKDNPKERNESCPAHVLFMSVSGGDAVGELVPGQCPQEASVFDLSPPQLSFARLLAN
ncbi:hypothetical protein BaRGS_00016153 [Batillaria attramentaria]|uniref:Uncharacterized protein n=1 Tax=Batillaria attramentaria TaxID=370345 RepID=A0ABD0KZL1_9CAEN